MTPDQATTTQEAILDQAIDWWTALHDEEVSPDTLDQFSKWLTLDTRHAQAYAEAEQLFQSMVEAAKTPPQSSKTRDRVIPLKKAKPLHRGLRYACGIAASWLLITQLLLPKPFSLSTHFFSDYASAIGEIKSVELEDGSHLLLNTNSAISVNFTEQQRSIRLLQGQVRFEVAHDAQRPFLVETGDLKIRALGTVFDIHQSAQNTQIVVSQHAVSISPLAAEAAGTEITLQEGQQIAYKDGKALAPAYPAQIAQALAWQQRKLVITDQPLSELLEQLERYRMGRIFIADPALRQLRVTGAFSLQNPEQILQHVCQALNLNAQSIGPWSFITHR